MPLFSLLSPAALILGVFPWLLVVGVFVRGGRKKTFGGWSSLVVQQWHAGNEPDESGRFIYIRGRKSGIVAWLLTTLSLDADVALAVLEGRIEFEQSSLSGKERTMIPLSSISSTEYGYHKPWRGALILFVITESIVSYLLSEISNSHARYGYETGSSLPSLLAGLLAGAIVAVLFYIYNRKLRLGFREHSNHFNGIEFKRSIIEGREVSEAQAGYICLLIQTLIENGRVPVHA